MTDPDFRALCAKLADAYEHELNKRGMGCELINSARALLDQPVADGELVEWLRESLDCALQSGNSESIKHHCQLLNVLGHPTPQPVGAPMTHLSPAAQTVLDAYNDAYESDRHAVAAALRATADRVVPENWFGPPENAAAAQREITRSEILAIAAELESLDD